MKTSQITRKQIEQLPKYVLLGNTAMRLYDKNEQAWLELPNIVYYRDAGHWSADIEIREVDGKTEFLANIPNVPALHGQPFIPIGYKEWRQSNRGYTDGRTKAYVPRLGDYKK